MDKSLNICTFNVRGLGDKTKRNAIFRSIRKNHKCIALLQETHSSVKIESLWRQEFGGTIIFSHGSSGACGVAIFIPRFIKANFTNTLCDSDGRYVGIDVEINSQNYFLLNIYAPTKDHAIEQNIFLTKITDILKENSEKNIIIGGDFNTPLNPNVDQQTGRPVTQSVYSKMLNEMMKSLELDDIWRIHNPDALRFTHRQNTKAGISHSRLDFFLTSRNLCYMIREAGIHSGIHSDHSMVKILISLEDLPLRGRGLWKFNTSLLIDSAYVAKVKQTISDTYKENSNISDKGLLWDVIKCEIRGMTISYSSFKAKERREYEQALEEKIKHYESEIMDKNTFNNYSLIKEEYEKINLEKTRGAMIRSRAKYIEHGEKSTKYFLSLEKKNSEIRHIKTLLVDGNIISGEDNVLEEQRKFYETLYAECGDTSYEFDDFLDNSDIPKISNLSRELCDENITIEECAKALRDMPNNKTPGSDGFPTEFYKFFWKDIKSFVVDTFTYAMKHGMLSIEQRRGILSLIPKKEVDLRMLKSWRPLTLLNTDYKILAKLLASRLQGVIDEIVSTDQKGYIKGRYIGENIRTLADLVDISKSENITGFIALIDFEKAFDTVKWSFLFQSLETMNFGPYFISWIKVLYTDICSCCMNNGRTSTYFNPSRGIRQGCPISSLLFIIVAEILSVSLKTSQSVSGITIDNDEFLISQLADDTTLFLKNKESLDSAIDLIERFHNVSGLKLNKNKTKIFHLGNTNHRPNESMHFKCLGIEFLYKELDMSVKNFEDKFAKFKSILNIWSQRDLTIKGKIAVVRSLAITQLLYSSSLLYVPDSFIDKVDKAIVNFVWSNKTPKIKSSTMVSEIANGGMKMPNFQYMIRSQKIMWVQRILSQDSKWKRLALKLMNIREEDLLLKHSPKLSDNARSLFYNQVLRYWYEFYSVEPMTQFIGNESLWNNRFITIDNKPVHGAYNNWREHGINFIADLYHNGNLLSSNQLSEKYRLSIRHLQYISLIDAIPSNWKSAYKKHGYSSNVKSFKNKIIVGEMVEDLHCLKSVTVYRTLIQRISKPPTAEDKWSEEFPILHRNDFKKFYTIPNRTVSDSKICVFQYKLLNRILPCKYNLCKWKLLDDDKCTFCNETETIEHLFFYCSQSKRFIAQVEDWLNRTYGKHYSISVIDFLFGVPLSSLDKFLQTLNWVILYAKWYMYTCNLANENFFLLRFLLDLKSHAVLEQYIESVRYPGGENSRWEELLNEL